MILRYHWLLNLKQTNMTFGNFVFREFICEYGIIRDGRLSMLRFLDDNRFVGFDI